MEVTMKSQSKPASAIPNRVLSKLHRTINSSIHELVFAANYLDQAQLGTIEDIEDAKECLTAVFLNLDQIEDTINATISRS